MIYNEHLDLKGKHAFLSPSQNSWLRYSEDQLVKRYKSKYRVELGTELHEFASIQITLKNKVTSMNNLVKAIKTYMFTKYSQRVADIPKAMKLIFQLTFLPGEVFETLKAYVNDAIGYDMMPEQILYYSDYCFGTADAITDRGNFLRIHDLKTGDTPASMDQLQVYAALYCLRNNIRPDSIPMELRIYQANGVAVCTPDPSAISEIINIIINSCKILTKIDQQEGDY